MKKWKEAVIGGFVWILPGLVITFVTHSESWGMFIGVGIGMIMTAIWIYELEEKKTWREGQTSIPAWLIVLLIIAGGIVLYLLWRLSLI